MGKKAKLKRIRKMASALPVLMEPVMVGDFVYGEELIKQGTKQLTNGEKVQSDHIYSRKKAVQRPVNHNRRMKKLYNKYGPTGAIAYAESVYDFVNGSTK